MLALSLGRCRLTARIRRRGRPKPVRREFSFALIGEERCRADLTPVSCPPQARGGPGPGRSSLGEGDRPPRLRSGPSRTTVVSPLRWRKATRLSSESDRGAAPAGSQMLRRARYLQSDGGSGLPASRRARTPRSPGPSSRSGLAEGAVPRSRNHRVSRDPLTASSQRAPRRRRSAAAVSAT